MLSWCLPKVDRLFSRLNKAFPSGTKITRYRAVANRCCELRPISAPKRHLPWRPKGWTKEAKAFQTLVSHYRQHPQILSSNSESSILGLEHNLWDDPISFSHENFLTTRRYILSKLAKRTISNRSCTSVVCIIIL